MAEIIALHEPTISGNEWNYVKECLDTEWVSSAGKYVDEFEQRIAQYTGAKYAVACVSGTSALQVSLRLAGVKYGDEVIVPALTFIAPINAVAYNGASPVFMDVDAYYNLDFEKTIEFIQSETVFENGSTYNKKSNKTISAILPVHIWGNAAWLDELVTLCEERNITVVEDASESLGTFYTSGKFSGKHTGTIGMMGCLSFNGNKIITTGGGGMILTDNEKLAKKARYLTTQANDDPLRYVHHEIGYNYRLSNIQAALGVAQLEQLPGFLKLKKEIYHYYVKAVETIEGLNMAKVQDYADINHWMNLLQIDYKTYGEERDTLMKRLNENGILCRPVWMLNHFQKPYRDFQNFKVERAEKLANNSLCLPSSPKLSNEVLMKVIKNL